MTATNRHTANARTFRAAMQQPIATGDSSVWQLQHQLISEEFQEFITESKLLIHMELKAERTFSSHEWERQKANTLKELADLAFVCHQYAAALGWDLDEALDRVWTSNMSKLDENGQPLRRNDGKILKGPNYRPPDLNDLVATKS